jgi:ankyrin repeat protein
MQEPEFLLAAFAGCEGWMDRLCRNGARIDQADSNAHTCLHAAAFSGSTAIIQRLLRAGAAVDAADSRSRSKTPLGYAAFWGAVRALLQAGANTSLACQHGMTPLHDAAFQGHAEVVFEAGASPAAHGSQDDTPLDLAAQLGRRDAASVLLQLAGGRANAAAALSGRAGCQQLGAA